MSRGCLLLLGATSLVFAAAAGADSQLTYVRTVGGQEHAQPPMEIANGMIRFASDLPSGQWMLFDSGKNLIILVDEQQGTYTPMSKETFERISAMQQQAMAQIEEQLAQLPPDQREQAMRSMPQMSDMMKKEAIHTERTTRTMNVGTHTCTVLEVYRGEQKTSETCVISRNALGIPKEDYGTLMALQEYFVDISSSFFEVDTGYFFGDAAREELPIYMVDFENGGQQITRFESASFDKISSDRFKLDPGLREKDMMSQMRP